MDITEYLISKGHYWSMSGGPYPVQGSSDSALVLYFNDATAMWHHNALCINTTSKTQ